MEDLLKGKFAKMSHRDASNASGLAEAYEEERKRKEEEEEKMKQKYKCCYGTCVKCSKCVVS